MNMQVNIVKNDKVIGSAVAVAPHKGDVTDAINRALDCAHAAHGPWPLWPYQIDVREV